jgi:hypothetical protein
MRRAISWLMFVGAGCLLVALPLWRFERTDVTGCVGRVPCDPRTYLPLGAAAGILTIAALIAIVTAVVLLLVSGVSAVRRLDAAEREGQPADVPPAGGS